MLHHVDVRVRNLAAAKRFCRAYIEATGLCDYRATPGSRFPEHVERFDLTEGAEPA